MLSDTYPRLEGGDELEALGGAEKLHAEDLLHVVDDILAFLAAIWPMETWSSLSAEGVGRKGVMQKVPGSFCTNVLQTL